VREGAHFFSFRTLIPCLVDVIAEADVERNTNHTLGEHARTRE
jgi:hypothetical protein